MFLFRRPHTPTPGMYMGRPTSGSRAAEGGRRDGGYHSDRRDDRDQYRRRSPSPYRRRSPSPYYRRRDFRSRSRSFSPRRREYSPRRY